MYSGANPANYDVQMYKTVAILPNRGGLRELRLNKGGLSCASGLPKSSMKANNGSQ